MPLDRLDPAYATPSPPVVPPPPPTPYPTPTGPYGVLDATGYTPYGTLAVTPPYPDVLDPEDFWVTAANLVTHDAKRSVNSDHEYTETWVVHVSGPLASPHVVLDSHLLPQPGEQYYQWEYDDGVQRYYRTNLLDQWSAVVDRRAKKREDTHFVYDVTVDYRGVADPLAKSPTVTEKSIPFQEHTPLDVHGIPVTNSANDPYESGIQVDNSRKQFVIERNLPLAAWNSLLSQDYIDTVNEFPHPIPGPNGPQVNATGDVIYAEQGTMRIADISPTYVERTPSPTAQTDIPFQRQRQWYVKVTAVIELDRTEFYNNLGFKEKRRWRNIQIDKGYNEFVVEPVLDSAGAPVIDSVTGYAKTVLRKKPIHRSPNMPLGEQLLDGKGKAIVIPKEAPELPTIGPGSAGTSPVAIHRFYTTIAGTTLVVGVPGLLEDIEPFGSPTTAIDTAPDSAKGTATVNSDGSFSFSPATGFVGWATFTYTVTSSGGTSGAATVAILVGVRPRVRVTDKCERKEWSSIFLWLGVG